MVPSAARLTRRQDPVVTRCRDAARGDLSGLVLIDGVHVLLEALRADVNIELIIATADWFETGNNDTRQLWSLARGSGALVYEATRQVMDAVSPVKSPSGIVALANWTPSPLSSVWVTDRPLVIGLVDVQDPGNVGAVIRAADGLGASGVVTAGASASAGGWRALRGAMGSTFRVPVAAAPLSDLLASATAAGATIWATALDATRSATELAAADLTTPSLVLLGNEGAGLPPAALDAASHALRVPMRPGLDSLNVTVTAALILYEARRQRDTERSSR